MIIYGPYIKNIDFYPSKKIFENRDIRKQGARSGEMERMGKLRKKEGVFGRMGDRETWVTWGDRETWVTWGGTGDMGDMGDMGCRV